MQNSEKGTANVPTIHRTYDKEFRQEAVNFCSTAASRSAHEYALPAAMLLVLRWACRSASRRPDRLKRARLRRAVDLDDVAIEDAVQIIGAESQMTIVIVDAAGPKEPVGWGIKCTCRAPRASRAQAPLKDGRSPRREQDLLPI